MACGSSVEQELTLTSLGPMVQHFRFLAALSGHADVAQLLCGASADIDQPAHDIAASSSMFSVGKSSTGDDYAAVVRR